MMSLATAIIAQRLLGPAEWLADCEAKHALRSALVPRSAHINIDLLCAFAGLLHAGEVVMMLEDYGLIEENLADEIDEDLLAGKSPEIVLKPHAEEAYRKYWTTPHLN